MYINIYIYCLYFFIYIYFYVIIFLYIYLFIYLTAYFLVQAGLLTFLYISLETVQASSGAHPASYSAVLELISGGRTIGACG